MQFMDHQNHELTRSLFENSFVVVVHGKYICYVIHGKSVFLGSLEKLKALILRIVLFD